MTTTTGYAAFNATDPLGPWAFERRSVGADDVEIEIMFCGICHSDLHSVRGEWGERSYPQIPGHEIVGHVRSTGANVSKYGKDDIVGVGCFVDGCRTCSSCTEGLEQYCENGVTGTYGGIEKETGKPTQGGYSNTVVVNQHFVVRIPDGLDPAAAAPLLCAGITTYSPLREWNAGPGKRVGVIGLGGLGHMAVKIASAMGAHVTMFTTSPEKVEDAERLGADEVVISKNADAMQAVTNSFDILLDTVGAPHDIEAEMNMLRRDGTLVMLGASPVPHPGMSVWPFITGRRRLAGSLVGGLAETQEMLDFCGQHGITSDVEVIQPDYINTAYERMLKGDVKYRFVIEAGF